MREIKKGMTHQLNGSRSSKGKYSPLYCYRRRRRRRNSEQNTTKYLSKQLQLFLKKSQEKEGGVRLKTMSDCEIVVACKIKIKRSQIFDHLDGCSLLLVISTMSRGEEREFYEILQKFQETFIFSIEFRCWFIDRRSIDTSRGSFSRGDIVNDAGKL